MRNLIVFVVIAALMVGSVGCASMSRTQKGTAIGAATGAAIGAIMGKQSGNTAVGAAIGAVVGGAAGAYIGNYMDKQAEEMQKDIEGARIERVGESIKITFDSGILFDVDKSTLRPEAQANLEKMATILKKYEDTNIIIEGHTDATGAEEYNQKLSDNRALSVSSYLSGLGVNPARFTTMGRGELYPVADNETVEGRQQNRRVELAIIANEKLRKVAEQQSSGG